MKNRGPFGYPGQVFFLMVWVLAGCSATPAVKYYTLVPVFERQADIFPAVSGAPLAIGVGPVEFPKLLDRRQIVTRESQHRVAVSEFHRWAGSLPQDFLRVLTRNMSMLLPGHRLAAFPWTDDFLPTWRIQLRVVQFDGRLGGAVVLNVAWSLRNPKVANEPAMKHTRIQEPASDATWDELIAAKSRAIGALSRAIADEIKKVSLRDR